MINKYDAFIWIVKVYDSLKTADQIPPFFKLIKNYERQFNIEWYDPIHSKLEEMKYMRKFKKQTVS